MTESTEAGVIEEGTDVESSRQTKPSTAEDSSGASGTGELTEQSGATSGQGRASHKHARLDGWSIWLDPEAGTLPRVKRARDNGVESPSRDGERGQDRTAAKRKRSVEETEEEKREEESLQPERQRRRDN